LFHASSELKVSVNLGQGIVPTGGSWLQDPNQAGLQNIRSIVGNSSSRIYEVSVTNYLTSTPGLSTVQLLPFCSTDMSSSNDLKIKNWDLTVIQVR
jgi:hypothetical protein